MNNAPDNLTRGQKVNADITALLRARNTLLWIVTREELRVERGLIEAAGAAQYQIRFWDIATGLTSASGELIQDERDPVRLIDIIRGSTERCVFVLRDLHKLLDPYVLRGVRSLARELQRAERGKARAIVVLTPSSDIPPELSGHATVIDYPIPDRSEIAKILDDMVASLPDEVRAGAAPNGTREAAIDAAVGLTAEEAASCYARSMVTLKRVDPAAVAQEKKRVIAREKVLTWYDPDPRGMDAVGGLDVLKKWLTQRRLAFSAKARAYGLRAPRGALLVGVSGCGKSLTAKCIAAAWGLPLLRLDMGALRSKYVGDSEANIRKALSVAEAIGNCVLWLDEIEKALGGSTGPQGDGGVSSDALGAVLSWLQERSSGAFVIATANDIRSLPPEMLRKGRFDEIFWVDLPTHLERAQILAATLKANRVELSEVQILDVARRTPNFTGAELAAIVPDGMFAAFADGERAVTREDLLTAAESVVPLATTAEDKIKELRSWAKGRARPASTPEAEQTAGTGRALDL